MRRRSVVVEDVVKVDSVNDADGLGKVYPFREKSLDSPRSCDKRCSAELASDMQLVAIPRAKHC